MSARAVAHPLDRQVRFGCVLGGAHTDVVLTPFKDKVFVLITQRQKIGLLLEATKEAEVTETGEPVYNIETKLGSTGEGGATELLARRLIDSIAKSGKSLLLGVAWLNAQGEPSVSDLKALLALVETKRCW
jgi:hypothetical protein